MGLMVVLCVLVVLGLVAIWRWGGLEVAVPWTADPQRPQPREAARRFLWYATVGITAGVSSGIVMFGAGGRLAMRLLAVTAGPAAQGRLTEAGETVGEITLGGTLGFMAFFGILIGTFFGLVYMVIRRWLPPGRWGGLVFGILLLTLVATRADPLRPENPDFDLVGPGWVAVTVFSALMIGYGVLVAAIAGRYSRWLPPLEKDLKKIAKYLPAYVIWGPSVLLPAVLLIIGCGGTALLARTEGLYRIIRSPRVVVAGRVLVFVVVAAAAPGFVVGVADIASRG
jgi:hypothetical protein